ncbi:uncharacterized protein DSM5745_03871 [Aspergillus mulundensis]|uniref:Uncharacterized protein n=1 Tax=Aspergillus mulundensis TaxID=1810919 RepID=A0A3D8SB41_9EURO|nr:hypothetical protein DSM5745_03871 [Aspergillus mulundensis]RDW83545.1 hypothetical protein DSM5745_03871 [Aspergillus mulundensis]
MAEKMSHVDPAAETPPPRGWWEYGYLAKLNVGIICLTFLSPFSTASKLCPVGSNLWNPSSVWLGFTNALYWNGAATSTLAAATVANRYGQKAGI